MQTTTRTMEESKHIALVAHDNCKAQLIRWVIEHKEKLKNHTLYATGTTGHMIAKESGLEINCLMSGPMGGDQQLGALISEGKIDMMIFYWDPLHAVPHDPDVKALLRISAVWNIPVATNRSSANMMITSPMLSERFEVEIPDYASYLEERLD